MLLLVDKFPRNVEVLYYPPDCTSLLRLRVCQAVVQEAASNKKPLVKVSVKRHRTENVLQAIGYISQ